jgi:1-aminocyclopropane-1-carboxylate deaminase/D-cysteine desulfhydrase-like pyridoxal-dependent ACC family enzyme
VIDSGTGTTATGVALGVALLGLPWRVVGVRLAGPEDQYRAQQERLVGEFLQEYGGRLGEEASGRLQRLARGPRGGAAAAGAAAGPPGAQGLAQLPLVWCQRARPRRFGKVMPNELRECQEVAKGHGILLDPIYTLAAWEVSWLLARGEALPGGPLEGGGGGDGVGGGGGGARDVVMLHTGGHMGLHGLAQRYPDEFG